MCTVQRASHMLIRSPRLRTDDFPSSAAFDAINAVLQGDEAERKSAIKQANAVFAFTLKNKAGKEESWFIDLKDKGVVGKGTGNKPNGTSYGPSLPYSDWCNFMLTLSARHSHPVPRRGGLWQARRRHCRPPAPLHGR